MKKKSYEEYEVELACKKANPDWDGKSFDYTCACYQSALKAYKHLKACLDADGHSGASFGITKNILIRLLNELPLAPITEEDFCEDEAYEVRGRTLVPCLRLSSLDGVKADDGTISYYKDINRIICINADNPNLCFSSAFISQVIDEMFPITMPYYPSVNKYKVYTRDFKADKDSGDYDTWAVLYVITPDCERVEVNKYFKEDHGEWVPITEDEYKQRYNSRLYK